jgi:hypothetical protein
VTFDGQDDGAGLMIGSAKNDGCSAISEFNKQRIGPGCSVGVDDDGGDLIKRDAANGLAGLFNLQETAVAGKVATVLSDVNDLIQGEAG